MTPLEVGGLPLELGGNPLELGGISPLSATASTANL